MLVTALMENFHGSENLQTGISLQVITPKSNLSKKELIQRYPQILPRLKTRKSHSIVFKTNFHAVNPSSFIRKKNESRDPPSVRTKVSAQTSFRTQVKPVGNWQDQNEQETVASSCPRRVWADSGTTSWFDDLQVAQQLWSKKRGMKC